MKRIDKVEILAIGAVVLIFCGFGVLAVGLFFRQDHLVAPIGLGFLIAGFMTLIMGFLPACICRIEEKGEGFTFAPSSENCISPWN